MPLSFDEWAKQQGGSTSKKKRGYMSFDEWNKSGAKVEIVAPERAEELGVKGKAPAAFVGPPAPTGKKAEIAKPQAELEARGKLQPSAVPPVPAKKAGPLDLLSGLAQAGTFAYKELKPKIEEARAKAQPILPAGQRIEAVGKPRPSGILGTMTDISSGIQGFLLPNMPKSWDELKKMSIGQIGRAVTDLISTPFLPARPVIEMGHKLREGAIGAVKGEVEIRKEIGKRKQTADAAADKLEAAVKTGDKAAIEKTRQEFHSAIQAIEEIKPPDWGKYLAGEFAQGAEDVVQGPINTARMLLRGLDFLASGIVPAEGYDVTKEFGPGRFLTKELEKSEAISQEIEKKQKGVTPIQEFIGSGVRGATGMVPQMAWGVWGPGTATEGASFLQRAGERAVRMLPFIIKSFGGYSREAEQERATPGQQALYAGLATIAEVATEAPIMDKLTDLLKGAGGISLAQAGWKNFLASYGQRGVEWLGNAAKEGFQEAGVDPLTGLAKKLVYKHDMPWAGKGGVWDWGQMTKDFQGGVSMGLIMFGLGMVGSKSEAKAKEIVGKPLDTQTMSDLMGQIAKDAAEIAGKPIEEQIEAMRKMKQREAGPFPTVKTDIAQMPGIRQKAGGGIPMESTPESLMKQWQYWNNRVKTPMMDREGIKQERAYAESIRASVEEEMRRRGIEIPGVKEAKPPIPAPAKGAGAVLDAGTRKRILSMYKEKPPTQIAKELGIGTAQVMAVIEEAEGRPTIPAVEKKKPAPVPEVPIKRPSLPAELQGLQESAKGMNREQFLAQYQAGLADQNLTRRETAQKIDAYMRRMMKITPEQFYDQYVKPAPEAGPVGVSKKPLERQAIEKTGQENPAILSYDEFRDAMLSPELTQIHNHRVRTRGYEFADVAELSKFLDQLERAAGSAKYGDLVKEEVEKAYAALYKDDIAGVTEHGERAVATLHEGELEGGEYTEKYAEGRGRSFSLTLYSAAVQNAIKKEIPFHADALESTGVKIPEGYVLDEEKNLYVHKPAAPMPGKVGPVGVPIKPAEKLFKPLEKKASTMSAAEINKELDRLDEQRSKNNQALIDVGRGDETTSEIFKKDDPLSRKAKAISDRRMELRREIEARYGPNAPSRLPERGFGAREKAAPLPPKGKVAAGMPVAAPAVPAPSPAAQIPPLKRAAIVNYLEKNLLTPIRSKRMTRRAAGEYQEETGVIRLKRPEDLPVIAHEVGHHLTKTLGLDYKTQDELEPLGAVLYPKYSKADQRKEGLAEFFRYYLINPAEAKVKAPKFYAEFEARIAQDPKIEQTIRSAQEMYNQYYTQDAVNYVKSHIVQKQPFEQRPFLTKAEKRYVEWFDDLFPLQKFMQTALGVKSEWEIPAAKNVYVLGRLARAADRAAHAILTEKAVGPDLKVKGKSLRDILLPVRERIDDFEAFLVARHAVELAPRGIKSGLEIAKAKEAVKALTSPEFEQTAKELNAYQDNMLDWLVDAGVFSQDTVNAWRTINQFYVPFHRVFGEETYAGIGKQGKYGDIAAPIKRMKGSERSIWSPIQSIVRNTYLFMTVAKHNAAAKALHDVAAITEDVGWLAEILPTPMEPDQIELTRLKKDLVAAGIPSEVLEDADLSRVALLFNPVRFARGKESRENILTVRVDGKVKFIQCHPELYRALEGLDRTSASKLIVILGKFTQALKAGILIHPNFATRNIVRDTGTRLLTTKGKVWQLPWNMIKGLYHVIGKTDKYVEAEVAGAFQSTRVSLSRDELRKHAMQVAGIYTPGERIKQITRSPLTVLEALLEISEESSKMGEFLPVEEAKGGGKEAKLDAAYAARESSLDFLRAGTIGREANRVIAFFNAALQGPDKLVREAKRDPVRFVIRGALLSLTSLAFQAMRLKKPEDEKRYQEEPRWKKDLYWISYAEDGTPIYIPKPFEAGVLFGSSAERILEYTKEHDPEVFADLMRSMKDALLPDILLTAYTPYLEVWANKSFFTGRPIVPMAEERLPAGLQYGPRTSEAAKALGQKIDISPRKIEHLIAGYTGTMGAQALDFLDMMAGKATMKKTTMELIPGLRGFTGGKLVAAASIDKFYKELSDLEQKYAAAKKGLYKKPININRLRGMQKAAEKMSELRKLIVIVQMQNISADKKRQTIDEINRTMVNLVRSVYGKEPIK